MDTNGIHNGSGKTLTSFKASQILSQQDDIKKVIFLVDRKDLLAKDKGQLVSSVVHKNLLLALVPTNYKNLRLIVIMH